MHTDTFEIRARVLARRFRITVDHARVLVGLGVA